MSEDILDQISGEISEEGGPSLPYLQKRPHGKYHMVFEKAIAFQSQNPKNEGVIFGVLELTDKSEGTTYKITEKLNAPGYAGKYARGRFYTAICAGLGRAVPTDADAVKALAAEAFTDRGGAVKGKEVTVTVRPQDKDSQYNTLDWATGHVGAAVDTPPPVEPSQEDKAKALGYVPNPADSSWYYHPETKDQMRLSAF